MLTFLVDGLGGDFVDLDPEAIVFTFVFVSKMDAFDFDVNVVQPIQQQSLEVPVFFFVLSLQVRLELL